MLPLGGITVKSVKNTKMAVLTLHKLLHHKTVADVCHVHPEHWISIKKVNIYNDIPTAKQIKIVVPFDL